ncbi:low molecular weight protein-tyrosine-phosphatase [Aureispira anguillae]|uniref:protein-tyrosine-phosphatase n=1 Tax=Aureispira anguillae TaxID=2864201 RepID=A0A915YL64_9BACT|nr:low molecular weight protein-tyrosine-phosphatase [Aureispira anguillae]BDS14971.1 low molecular weight phosphotyrosine protein phosphatase [Aureispira anguillae]
MKFLMVCLGNICRSPLAEGILKAKAVAGHLEWVIDSAGTSAYHAGELPDRRSIAIAESYGIDITDQRSRPITPKDLDDFDVIYVMDSSNYNNVMELCENAEQQSKVQLIMNMAEPGRNIAVPDPYWEDDGFRNVYLMLDKACTAILAEYQ